MEVLRSRIIILIISASVAPAGVVVCREFPHVDMDGLHILVILCSSVCSVFSKTCLKNEEIGWRTGNIYECKDPDKPACCEQDKQFVCCEYNTYKNLREQLELWGSVLFFCGALFVVYLYYRCDSGLTFPTWLKNVKGRFLNRKTSMDFQHVRYLDNDLMPATRQNKGSP